MLTAGMASLLLLFAPYVAAKINPAWPLLPILPIVVMYCFVISAIAHYFVVKAIASQSKGFINVFMGGLGVKLMLFFAFIILYSFTHKNEAVVFLVWFMIYYLVFIAIDVAFLLVQNSQLETQYKK